MSEWTYSRYDSGHQRFLPKNAVIEDDEEDDESALEAVAEICAKDDHDNYDGWEGDRSERDVYLFRDGRLHSHFVVTVDYEPNFSAARVALAKCQPKEATP